MASFVTAADLNGDGNLDLVVASTGSVSAVIILFGNGDGTFAKPKYIFNVGVNPMWIAVADFNGDGIPDLALADCPTCFGGNGGPGSVTILLGTGGGNFGTPATFDSGGTGTQALAALDFNGDGKMDLAAGNNASGTVALLAGNGNGTFAAPRLIEMVGARAIATGDFNGDGKTDLSRTTR